MRGSKFEQLSVTEAYLKQKDYIQHQEKLKKAKPSIPDQQEIDSILMSYNNKKKVSKGYQLLETDRVMNADHQRLLSKFEEIQQGRLLSVGKSKIPINDKTLNSPVAIMNSLNFTKKLKDLKVIDDQNQKMISKLNSPRKTISNKILGKEWMNIQRLKKMISKQNRQDSKQIQESRIHYLQKNFSNMLSHSVEKSIQEESLAKLSEKRKLVTLNTARSSQKFLQNQDIQLSQTPVELSQKAKIRDMSQSQSKSTLEDMHMLENTFKDINHKFMKQTDSLIQFKNNAIIREETEFSLPVSQKNEESLTNLPNQISRLKRIYNNQLQKPEKQSSRLIRNKGIGSHQKYQSVNNSISINDSLLIASVEKDETFKKMINSHNTSITNLNDALAFKEQRQNDYQTLNTHRVIQLNQKEFVLPPVTTSYLDRQNIQIQKRLKHVKVKYDTSEFIQDGFLHKRKNSPFNPNLALQNISNQYSIYQSDDQNLDQQTYSTNLNLAPNIAKNQQSKTRLESISKVQKYHNQFLNYQFHHKIERQTSRYEVAANLQQKSLTSRGAQNQTIVVKFSGSPLSTIQQQKDIQYKEKVLKANQRNIYKRLNDFRNFERKNNQEKIDSVQQSYLSSQKNLRIENYPNGVPLTNTVLDSDQYSSQNILLNQQSCDNLQYIKQDDQLVYNTSSQKIE